MSDDTPTPPAPPVMRVYHVLLMAAVSVTIQAETEELAMHIASTRGGESLDPAQIPWVPRAVSDRPFEIAEPGETEETRLAVEVAEANRQRMDTPRIQLLN